MLRAFFLPLTLGLLLSSVPGSAATVTSGAGTLFSKTKLWKWQWGDPPRFRTGEEARSWLLAKPHPDVKSAPEGLRREVIRHFKLTDRADVRYAVLGPPRVTNGHYPKFWAWVEVEDGEGYYYFKKRIRPFRRAGVAKMAIEEKGDASPVLYEFLAQKDIPDEQDLNQAFPWDVALVLQKMLRWKAIKPGN